MSVALSLVGESFGRLEVVAQAPSRHRMTYWLCRCLCGNETVVRGMNLTHEIARSCGCMRKETRRLSADEKRIRMLKKFARDALAVVREQRTAAMNLSMELRIARKEAAWADKFRYRDELELRA